MSAALFHAMTGAPLLAADVEWLRPEWTLLAIAALGVLWLQARARSQRRKALASAFDGAAAEYFSAGWDPGRSRLRAVLAALAVVATGVAAGGPVWGFLERRALASGVDLVVCVDTSRSMLARDLKPDRLERAKREVRGLLEILRDDRLALVAFSGDARDIAPLTNDRQALTDLLERLDSEDNRLGGTDLGAALERALELLSGRTGASEAIVILTDGEDLSGRGAEVAAQARSAGIRVFVVGIGSEAGAKLPVVDDEGRERFLVGPDGQEVVSRLDDDSLAAVATAGGGEYLTTQNSPAPLSELFRYRISDLEAREVEAGLERVPIDRYQWPLGFAFLVILWELSMFERRVRSRSGGAAVR